MISKSSDNFFTTHSLDSVQQESQKQITFEFECAQENTMHEDLYKKNEAKRVWPSHFSRCALYLMDKSFMRSGNLFANTRFEPVNPLCPDRSTSHNSILKHNLYLNIQN
eukprot:365494_1